MVKFDIWLSLSKLSKKDRNTCEFVEWISSHNENVIYLFHIIKPEHILQTFCSNAYDFFHQNNRFSRRAAFLS